MTMKLTIEISNETADQIKQHLIDHPPPNAFNSHGPLTLKSLAEMLMEDIGLSITRPGSWEGANMHTVLRAHGSPW
jgi:hypothetical protein